MALLAASPLFLAACAAGMGGEAGPTGGFSLSGTLGAAPLVDTAGRAWQPTVERSYVSAIGFDCAAVALTPVTGGLPIHRVLCVENGRIVVAAPLILAPGEADPRFAPVAVPGSPSSESAPAETAPFSQRSPS